MSENQFLTEVLPLALAGSCSPTTLVIGILILTSKHRPLSKTFVFVLGNLLVLAAVGVVTLFFAHATTTATASHSNAPNPVDATLDVFVGALLIVLTVRNYLKASTDDAPPKWLTGIDTMGYLRSFLIGLGIMAINVSTLVVFLPAVRYVGKYSHTLASELWLLALVILIVESWMLVALGISIAAPGRSGRALRRLNGWVGRHNRTICLILFTVFGVYFLVKGLIDLL